MTEQDKDRLYEGCYGRRCSPSEVQAWVLRNLEANIARYDSGIPRSTLNIWGVPGCSKTSIVKQLASRKVAFGESEKEIQVIDIPLAQIEEMGDVLGYPVEEIQLRRWNGERPADAETSCEHKWVKAVDSVIRSHLDSGWELTDSKRTTYAPPSWAPVEECPGVILFDDGNRASQRIMKGLMQLVQDYRTISWSIPRGWTICFTGNPDNRLNQVTSMDTAQLTRMRHITLEFNAREWAVWAQGQGIDQRGINFMLRYPEMAIGGMRTNPRSLTEFFLSLPFYPNLQDEQQLHDCMVDACASIDEETANVFATFAMRDGELVVSPEVILRDPDKAEILTLELLNRNEPRIDLVSVTMDRLVAYIMSPKYEMASHDAENFQRWFLLEKLPKDMVYASLNTLANSRCVHVRKLLANKRILEMGRDMLCRE